MSSVIGSKVTEVLTGGVRVLEGSKGLGEDAGANITGEARTGLFLAGV